jgi:hypothetical protein
MAYMLYVHTARPHELLDTLKALMTQRSIRTWRYDGDGNFLPVTGSGPEKCRAWLRPVVLPGALCFQFRWPKGAVHDREVYGNCLGRFTEMLLTRVTGANGTAIVAYLMP